MPQAGVPARLVKRRARRDIQRSGSRGTINAGCALLLRRAGCGRRGGRRAAVRSRQHDARRLAGYLAAADASARAAAVPRRGGDHAHGLGDGPVTGATPYFCGPLGPVPGAALRYSSLTLAGFFLFFFAAEKSVEFPAAV